MGFRLKRAAWFTIGDGTEWNEAIGRAIALSFD